MTNLGQHIKEIRWSLGLTMDEFGEIVGGVKSGVVSNWENNKQKPNVDRLKKIADLGKMTVVELVNGKSDYKQLYEQQKHRADELKNDIKQLGGMCSLERERGDKLQKRWKKLTEYLNNDLKFGDDVEHAHAFKILRLMRDLEEMG